MPPLRNYDLFISHAWRYGDEYNRLLGLLNQAPLFKYRNYSAPEHKPLFERWERVSPRELATAIDRKIRRVHCVLVIGGMYAAHREWIQTEIDIARERGKPVICVKPLGSRILPKQAREASWCEPVSWRTEAIVRAIRQLAL